MGIIDRLLTIVITATATSAVWIVAGGSIIENTSSMRGDQSVRPAEAAPSPDTGPGVVDRENGTVARSTAAPPLDRGGASNPAASETRDLMIPVLNIRASELSDTFTDSRGSGSRLHEAIDIMAPEGTSVVAAAPGTIEKLFLSDAGGKTIYVRSPDRQTIHYYAHLADYAPGLKEGQKIARGQRLGTVGSTGNAAPDAPHLHFAIMRTTPGAEWWEPANALNPYPLLTR